MGVSDSAPPTTPKAIKTKKRHPSGSAWRSEAIRSEGFSPNSRGYLFGAALSREQSTRSIPATLFPKVSNTQRPGVARQLAVARGRQLWELAHDGCLSRDMGVSDSAPPTTPKAIKTKKRHPSGSAWRSEADSNRCSSFCRAVPSHSAIRPAFRSANIQTFFFSTKFTPFFHQKVQKLRMLAVNRGLNVWDIRQKLYICTTPWSI